MNKQHLFILLTFTVMIVGLLFTQPNRSTIPYYKNLDSSVQYVGDEECAACHADIYNSFIRTGMGRSFYPAGNAEAIEDFKNNAPIYDANNNFFYKASLQEGNIIQTEYRINAAGEKIHELNRGADYVMGSGNHNRTYVTVQNGFVKELPLTWYVDKKKWDLSPGYHTTNMRFFRPIVEECMHCHNSFTDFEPNSQNKYNTPLPHGIGCERCHGPGRLHVQSRIDNKNELKGNIDYTIVNPKHLPFQEQLDVCQQCHLQGEISVFQPDKRSTDFRPGIQLSSVKSIFMEKNQKPNEFRIASHAERLAKSACFQQSGSLTCITCHNPHVPVQEHSRRSFNDNCLACHDPKTLIVKNIENHKQDSDCVKCHMTQSGTADIPHVNFTDHKIQIPKRIQPTTTPISGRIYNAPIELVNFFTIEKSPNAIQTGIAYVRYFESRHQHKDYLIKAIAMLKKSLQENEHQIAGWYHLGRAYHLTGDLKNAESAYYQTIAQDPNHTLAFAQLGVLAFADERLTQALSSFRRSINSYPYNPVVWNNYGHALLFSDSTNAALAAYTMAISLDPDYANAFNNRGELLLYKQTELSKGKNDFLSCLALDPDHIFALHNMSNIALLEEDLENAERFALQALTINSDFVPAYGTLATVFQRQGRLDEAKRVLSRIIKLDKNNADARKILDSLRD